MFYAMLFLYTLILILALWTFEYIENKTRKHEDEINQAIRIANSYPEN